MESGGGKTLTGDYGFEINDPDDVRVEFVQSLPTGVEAQEQFQRSADLALYIALLLIVSLSSRLLDHCSLGPIAADPTYGLECRDECPLSCVTNIAFPFWMRPLALINKSNSERSPHNGRTSSKGSIIACAPNYRNSRQGCTCIKMQLTNVFISTYDFNLTFYINAQKIIALCD